MIGLLYDIHGNAAALDAVLGDAEDQGVEKFILGGDYTLFGPRPAETLEILQSLDAEWIRGNGERWTASPKDAPDDELVQQAVDACRKLIGKAAAKELGELPECAVHDGTRYCHGSPVSDVRSFLPQPAEDEPELLEGVKESRLVFGHTHVPFNRTNGNGIELVNPGSVGMPFDGDRRAAYGLLHHDGHIEQRRVAYRHQEAAAEVRERLGPWAGVLAQRIGRARYDV